MMSVDQLSQKKKLMYVKIIDEDLIEDRSS